MVNFNFKIDNPFTDRFANLFSRHGMLSKYKAWEFELLKVNCIVNLSLEFTTQQDHAGLRIELGLFGYELGLVFFDTRHWDHKNNCWEVNT
jgi:hypothetical protein